MKNTINDIKKTLGTNTEKLEQQAKQLWVNHSHHYTHLEPWQRGLILLSILVFLTLAIYYLTHESEDKISQRKTQLEALQEERMLKKLELFKKLRE